MKKIFATLTILLFIGKMNAQQPVFLSPYKSGKPVAESSKDYSKPVPINLLNGADKKQAASTKADNTLVVTPADANKKPAVQSSNKTQGKN